MMLDREQIETALRQKNCAYKLCCLEQTDSTNAEARRAAVQGAEHGLVITAETQSAGRGRRGRSWVSPAGENLYFSLLLFPEFAQEKAQMLTLTAALAVAQAIREYGIDARIKWPNDVVADGRKLCGILTELGWRPDGRYFVIVGIGINVNQRQFPEEISQTAGSLCLQSQKNMDRSKLLAAVLSAFSSCYDRFCAQQDMSGLMEEYEAILVNRGRQVRVLDPKGEWTGTAQGINSRGELLVCREDLTVEAVYAGEVSVRGIYGYV